MASVKNLKKDLNNIIGEIIQSINLWELDKSDKDLSKSEKLVDQCFDAFDEIIKKIHQKDVKNKKEHFKNVSLDLTVKASALVASFNKL
jgi:hypothetical protein|tara:strand:+ start:193 stop:459 length:267 start_codon:yes stop_codon:yes gene_type:complete